MVKKSILSFIGVFCLLSFLPLFSMDGFIKGTESIPSGATAASQQFIPPVQVATAKLLVPAEKPELSPAVQAVPEKAGLVFTRPHLSKKQERCLLAHQVDEVMAKKLDALFENDEVQRAVQAMYDADLYHGQKLPEHIAQAFTDLGFEFLAGPKDQFYVFSHRNFPDKVVKTTDYHGIKEFPVRNMVCTLGRVWHSAMINTIAKEYNLKKIRAVTKAVYFSSKPMRICRFLHAAVVEPRVLQHKGQLERDRTQELLFEREFAIVQKQLPGLPRDFFWNFNNVEGLIYDCPDMGSSEQTDACLDKFIFASTEKDEKKKDSSKS